MWNTGCSVKAKGSVLITIKTQYYYKDIYIYALILQGVHAFKLGASTRARLIMFLIIGDEETRS